MSQIIAVHSFKGGTGKSIIASALAYHCSEILKEKTIILDCDFGAPSLNTFFCYKKKPTKTIIDVLESKVSIEKTIIKSDSNPNLNVIFSPNPNKNKQIIRMDDQWHARALQNMFNAIKELQSKYQYKWIIFDNQSGISMNSMNFLSLSTTAIIVVRPSKYAAAGSLELTNILSQKLNLLSDDEDRRDIVIWNQIPKGDNRHHKVIQLLDNWNSKFLGINVTPGVKIPYFDDLATYLFLEDCFNFKFIYSYLKEYIMEIVEMLKVKNIR